MKILATTDGTPRSLGIVPHASRLAEAMSGELVLARILSPLMDAGSVVTPKLEDAVRVVSERWTDELTAVLAEAKAAGRAVVEVRQQGEDTYQSILRLMGREGVDVVALTSRGSGLFRHTVVGAVALSILGKSTTPVLVGGEHLSAPVRSNEYHILVTSDGSEDSTRAIDAVVPLSRHDGVKVTLLRIDAARIGDHGAEAELAAARAALETLRSRFPDPTRVSIEVRELAKPGGVEKTILQAANDLGANAIAISSHGHSRRYHVFLGSTALGVLRHSQLPLLLVRSSAKS